MIPWSDLVERSEKVVPTGRRDRFRMSPKSVWILWTLLIVSAPRISSGHDVPTDYWEKFGELIKSVLEAKTCGSSLSEIVDSVSWCWESFETEISYFSKHELTAGAGCCIKGKLEYCIKVKVDSLCPGVSGNVTETAISYLRVFMKTTCADSIKPEYPTLECDAILMPAQTWIGIIGLIIAVSIFSAFMAVLVFLILLLSRRVRSRDAYMTI